MPPRVLPKPIVNVVFMLGIVSGLGFRSLTILDVVLPHAVRRVWYAAVIGYLFFFGYRYFIAVRRRHVVKSHRLVEKVSGDGDLSAEDRAEIAYIVESLVLSKERWNYLFIFIISCIAIVIDQVLAGNISSM